MKKPVKIGILTAIAAVAIAGAVFFLQPPTGAEIPSVFVHGYNGWGSYDEKYDEVPYWGTTTIDIRELFEIWDQDVYMASVGPDSSAWDRACELYAEITGTRVDYGAAHSEQCGHERFGRDYSDRPLIPDFTWDEKHPVNLIGHSFGGTTVRVLLDLLADGAPEEVAATGDETSPLFTGGHAGMVFSLSTIASPHNGTTLIDCLLQTKEKSEAKFPQKSAYDAYLDQFGLYSDENTTEESATAAMKEIGFYKHYDSAINDMSVDRACAMNADIELQPGVYYFCYYGCRTEVDSSGNSVSKDNMCKYLQGHADLMGSYTGKTKGRYFSGYDDARVKVTVPPQELDEEWQPNDGTVNTMSAYCPYHLDGSGERIYDAHVEYSGSGAVEPGVWNILPMFDQDHYGFIGGIYSEEYDTVRQFYYDMHNRLDELKVE